jgi:parvulin-like peptidyl-prolyl isomerase
MEDKEKPSVHILKNVDKKTIKLLTKSNLVRPLIKSFIINNLIEDINLTNSEVNEECSKFYESKGIIDSINLNKYLAHYGITEEDLKHQILLPLKILKFSKEFFQKKVDTHFLKRKESLDMYTYNILRLDNFDLAYELYFQLQDKESDFNNLSFQYSIDSNIFPNGIAGPRSLDGLHPKIVEVLKSASPGILIEPFAVERWWLIIKIIEKNQASLDFQNSNLMFQELFDKYVEEKTQLALLNELKYLND